MAPAVLTQYELQRLENIRRKEEIMAGLKLQSIVSQLKRKRFVAKANKASPQKKLKDESPVAVRRSLRTRGLPADSKGLKMKGPKYQPTGPMKRSVFKKGLNMREALLLKKSNRSLIETILGPGENSEQGKSLGTESGGDRVCKEDDYWVHMTLNPENVASVGRGRITDVKFFPCSSSRIVVVGNAVGDIGFWNLDRANWIEDEEENGMFTYHTHPGPVSGISIHQHSLSKIFTSCHDGYIRLMDVENEVFNLAYSSGDNDAIYSLSQRSDDAKCVYFGEGFGSLNMWDERTGSCATQWSLHGGKINSIDFSLENPNFMATSCSDRTACIWDLRSINADKPKALKMVRHKNAVHAAYFSPSGKCLATTSMDNTICILGGANFEATSRIRHKNCIGGLFSLKAIWGWDDSFVFTGNSMERAVDVISPSEGKTIGTLQGQSKSATPWRFDAHPYRVGMLAGATRADQVCVWTRD